MRVWITKYALTRGIEEKDAKLTSVPTMIDTGGWHGAYHKPDWHETEADAIGHAENIRIRKITSLRKQIEKLENLTFARQP